MWSSVKSDFQCCAWILSWIFNLTLTEWPNAGPAKLCQYLWISTSILILMSIPICEWKWLQYTVYFASMNGLHVKHLSLLWNCPLQCPVWSTAQTLPAITHKIWVVSQCHPLDVLLWAKNNECREKTLLPRTLMVLAIFILSQLCPAYDIIIDVWQNGHWMNGMKGKCPFISIK